MSVVCLKTNTDCQLFSRHDVHKSNSRWASLSMRTDSVAGTAYDMSDS